ncbi:MAG TPA: aspartate:alanine exchanger family transporter [Roseiflexaceae bacterium]|nr:aspartate:alanine exchanger family transporter [Roseiflexaceae bacterium]
MIKLLIDNPLLLLFSVAAIGYPLGRIRIGGTSLGVAAVLFVGLGFGALHPDMKLPEVVYLLGLVLFVYTVGISNGPGFFASFRRKGLRDNLLVLSMICLAVGLVIAAAYALGLRPTVAAGMFAGTLTNTPTLASALEHIKNVAPPEVREQLLADPVIGYSITYPMGVIGMILAIVLTQRLWKIDYAAEARGLHEPGAASGHLQNWTFRVTERVAGESLFDLIRRHSWDVVVGRVQHEGHLALATAQTRLATGDMVSVIGTPEVLGELKRHLGEPCEERLDLDRRELDYRRIFVSNRAVVGRRLRDLDVQQRFGALVTRVRRGDVELLPHGETVLEPGDRVRVVAPRERMDEISAFFGDSYKALSEVDVLTFNLGLALGILVGLLPIPLPGGLVVKLGFAGGPLLVALILGTLGRTGPLVWSLPYSANLTLRQIGLVLFLASVGTRAGYAFRSMLMQGDGLGLLLVGALITCAVALLTLWIGYKLLHIPMNLLIGMLAGLQTQPAVLGFALEQTENDLPNVGYATVYPVATIAKIVAVQVILAVLGTGG